MDKLLTNTLNSPLVDTLPKSPPLLDKHSPAKLSFWWRSTVVYSVPFLSKVSHTFRTFLFAAAKINLPLLENVNLWIRSKWSLSPRTWKLYPALRSNSLFSVKEMVILLDDWVITGCRKSFQAPWDEIYSCNTAFSGDKTKNLSIFKSDIPNFSW